MKIIRKTIFSLVPIVIVAGIAVGAYYLYLHFTKKKQNEIANQHNNFSKDGYITKDSNKIRIMHWNILNFGGKKHTQNSAKVYGIASLILKSQSDIIGLTEVNYDDGDKVERIIKELKILDPSKNFKSIIQPLDESISPNKKYKNNKEQIAIIYNDDVVIPLEFNNHKVGHSFMSQISTLEDTGANVVNSSILDNYTRNPFGVKFAIKQFHKNLTTVFAHLDSPGKGKADKKEIQGKLVINGQDTKVYIKTQGDKELSEALGIKKIFEEFDNLDDDSNYVFGGDTNIKTENADIFNVLTPLQSFYNSANAQKFETSLGLKNGTYANSYDKWLFYENNLDFSDERATNFNMKIDLWKVFENNLINRDDYIKKYQAIYGNKASLKYESLIRKELSDHCPIIIDVANK